MKTTNNSIHPKILIVDDEMSIRVTLSEFLKEEDFIVEIAENVEIAMDLLSKYTFDVVVTDIIMPQISGIKFLKLIKENHPTIQVILMTGEPTIETASMAIRTNAFDYLTKPVGKKDIIKAVSSAIKVKKIDDERRHLLKEKEQYQDNLEHLVDLKTADLEESEARFKAISESASDSIISINDEGQIIFVNKATESIFGINKNELFGQNLGKLIPSRYWEDHQRGFNRLLKDGAHKLIGKTIEINGKRNGSTEFPIELSLATWQVNGKNYFTAIIRDITNRKKAKENQRISEENYKNLYENVPLPYQALDENGSILDVNPAWLKTFGYEREEVIGICMEEFLNPDIKPRFKSSFEKFKKTGETDIPKMEFKHNDGHYLTVSLKGIIGYKPDGSFLQTYCVLQDITQQQKTQQALVSSEELFRKSFYTSPDSININRLEDGMYVSINRGFTQITGYTEEEVIGKTSAEIDIWAEYESRLELVAGLKKNGEVKNLGTYFRKKNGDLVYGLMSATIIHIKEVPHILSITRDISKRIKSEQALKESQRQLSTLMGNVPGNAYRCKNDSNWTMELISNGSIELTGYSPLDLIENNKISFGEIIHKEDRQKVFDLIKEKTELKESFQIEYRIISSDGTEKWVWEQGQAIYGNQDEIIALEGFIIDITERVHSTAQLKLQASALEEVANAMVITDFKGNVQWVNPAFSRLTGYSFDEVIGKNPRILKSEKQDIDFYKQMWKKIIRGENWQGQIINKRKNGELYHEEMTITPLETEKGKIINYIAVKQDVSERILQQQKLAIYTKQLETLNIVTAALSTSLELNEVLSLILDKINDVIPIDSASLFLYDHKNNLRIVADRGITPSQKDDIHSQNNPFLNKIKQTGKPLIINSIKDEPQFFEFGPISNIESWIGLPLSVRGRIIGFLTLDKFEPNAFSSEDLDLSVSFASQAAQAIDNARQLQETSRLLNQMDALRKIDQSIISSGNLDDTLEILLEQITNQLAIDAVVILKYDPKSNKLNYLKSKGLKTNALKYSSVLLGESLAGESAKQEKYITISGLDKINQKFSKSPGFPNEKFVSYHCVPLISKGRLMGVVELFHRSSTNNTDEWIKYLHMLAGQTAIAIDDAMLFENLETSNKKILKAYDETIEGWATALELRDMETEGHSRRVTDLTIELAQKLGINDKDELLNIRYGALLHDIGKIGVPDNILNKPGKLTEEEWETMKMHPTLAFKWFSSIEYLKPALTIPYCHHERWDGTGYPRGLKAEEIPFAARIFAVIDVWDALLSDRPYRKAWTKEDTLKHIQNESGKHFDPRVVEEFLKCIQ